MKRFARNYSKLVGILITLTWVSSGIEIAGIALFKWMLLGLCIVGMVYRGGVGKLRDTPFSFFIICILLSLVGSWIVPYIDSSFVLGNVINFMLIYISVTLISTKDARLLFSFFEGIKISCVIQGIYCIIQYIFRSLTSYSLNKMIFGDLLGIKDPTLDRVIINEGHIIEYGINAHPSVLIPVIIILLCFLENKNVGIILSLAMVILSRNSTAGIAMVLCLILPLVYKGGIALKNNSFIVKRKSKFYKYLFVIITGILVLIITGWGASLIEVMARTWSRIFASGSRTDNSTQTHILYYLTIPKAFRNMSFYNVIFGNGINSSGDVVTNMHIVLNLSKNWAIESDPIDLLYGVGVVGTIVFYYWLIKRSIRSWKWNSYYYTFLFSIIICGVTYRIQYLWVVMFELVLFKLISMNVDVLECSGVRRTKHRPLIVKKNAKFS